MPPRSISPPPLDSLSAVRSTDLDALLSRAYASRLSYLSDPFASLFLPSPIHRSLSSPSSASIPQEHRRPPLINLGTHARTWAVDELVRQFLEANAGGCQVLSIGAGTDTRFWRMREEWEKEGKEWKCKKWMEVDLEEQVGSKARVVCGNKGLKERLGGDVKIERGGTLLTSPLYVLSSLNLLSPPSTFSQTVVPHLSSSIPTLLLSECVMIYLPSSVNESLLSWFSSIWGGEDGAGGGVVTYDPFGLQDNFGKVMVRNLATRGLHLPSVEATPTLSSLEARLTSSGFCKVGALSIHDIRSSVIPSAEIDRSVFLPPSLLSSFMCGELMRDVGVKGEYD